MKESTIKRIMKNFLEEMHVTIIGKYSYIATEEGCVYRRKTEEITDFNGVIHVPSFITEEWIEVK